MPTPSAPRGADESSAGRRRYDSPVRRERAAATRERIVGAGAELVHTFPSWDWRELTVRAVAVRAGVNERTVYRHFATERELRDAILQRLEEEAGVSLDGLALRDFAGITSRVIAYLSTFAVEPRVVSDPTFVEVDRRRRTALLGALEPLTPDWPEQQRALAAAMLDVFWSVQSYERMTTAWGLDRDEVTRAVTWVIGLVEEAIGAGRRPASGQGDRE